MQTTPSPSSLSDSFLAWRKAKKRASIGAIALVSFASHSNAMETARFVKATVTARMTDDEIRDDETKDAVTQLDSGEDTAPVSPLASGSYLLSASEREALRAIRPNSCSLVFRAVPVSAISEDDALPADYVPRIISDYVPRLIRDAEIEAEATREAAIEVAEIEARDKSLLSAGDYDSGYTREHFPIDYAPRAIGSLAVSRMICAALGGLPEGMTVLEGGAKETNCPMEALRLAVLAM